MLGTERSQVVKFHIPKGLHRSAITRLFTISWQGNFRHSYPHLIPQTCFRVDTHSIMMMDVTWPLKVLGTRSLHHMLVSDIPSAKCLCPHNPCSHNNWLELGTCSQLLHLLGLNPQPPTWLGESTTNRSRGVAICLSSKRSVWAEQQSTHRYLTFKPGSGKTMIMWCELLSYVPGTGSKYRNWITKQMRKRACRHFPSRAATEKGKFLAENPQQSDSILIDSFTHTHNI